MEFNNYAFMCEPADTIDGALRMENRGDVNIVELRLQHRQHRSDLASWLGFTVSELPKQNKYADSTFTEDPAVVLQNGYLRLLVVARLKEKSRQGEEAVFERFLAPHFGPNVRRIEGTDTSGFLEGGDVLVTDHALYVGISRRTDIEGGDQLAQLAKDYFNIPSYFIDVPEKHLHLRSFVSYHRGFSGQGPVITVAEGLAPHFEVAKAAGCSLLVIPDEEHERCYGPNSISMKKRALVHEGASVTQNKLEKLGFEVKPQPLSQFKLIDGAMSCLSKLVQSTVWL